MMSRYELRDLQGTTFVPPSDIHYIEGNNNYSLFHLADGTVNKQCDNIGAHFDRLKATGLFFRVHRSYAVNITQVVRIESGTVILYNGTELPLKKGNEAALRIQILGFDYRYIQ